MGAVVWSLVPVDTVRATMKYCSRIVTSMKRRIARRFFGAVQCSFMRFCGWAVIVSVTRLWLCFSMRRDERNINFAVARQGIISVTLRAHKCWATSVGKRLLILVNEGGWCIGAW